jgi:hypothetical protein
MVDNTLVLDQGWIKFSIAHNLRVGYFLAFKKTSLTKYIVTIFDYTCCEVMTKCSDHG